MQTLVSYFKIAFQRTTALIAWVVPHLDRPFTRIAGFLGLIWYIAEKSVVDMSNHIRTFESFIILGIGLTFILRGRDKWSDWAGLGLILLLTLAPIYWRMHGFDRDGFSLLGVLPGSDANGYFTGALNLLYGEDIPPFAARRPLFITYLATILGVTGQNLILTLIIMAMVVSVALWLLTAEIRESFGVLPAALTAVIMIYCYAGRYTGKFLTEQLGIPLGMLALTIFLQGIRRKKFNYFVGGLFILTIALNARAGAMFALPLLAMWGATWHGRSKSLLRNLLILCGTVSLGFLINFGIFRFISSPGSIPFANFGFTLYGIVTGYRGWKSWNLDFPGASDAEAFEVSLEIIRNSPDMFLKGMARAYQEFLNPQYFFSFLYLPPVEQTMASLFLLILTGIALWRLVKNIRLQYAQLLLCVLAGILLSVPFAPPSDDAIRAMTATTSFLALLTGSAFISTHKLYAVADQNSFFQLNRNAAIYFSVVLILLPVVGWTVTKSIVPVPRSGVNCGPQEQPVVLTVTPYSYVNVVRNQQQSTSFLPNLRRVDMQKNLSEFPPGGLWKLLRQVESEQTIMIGLNMAGTSPTSTLVWLVAPTDAIQNIGGANYFCAKRINTTPLENGDFLVDSQVESEIEFP